MTIKIVDKPPGRELFVTGLDDRELTEVRRLSRPTVTKAERRESLIKFIGRFKPDLLIAEVDEIFVWA